MFQFTTVIQYHIEYYLISKKKNILYSMADPHYEKF